MGTSIVETAKSASEAETDYDHSVTSFDPSVQSSVKSKSSPLKLSPKKKKASKNKKNTDQSSVVSDPKLDEFLGDDCDEPKSSSTKSPVKKVDSTVSDGSASPSVKSGMFAFTITDLIKGNDMKHSTVKDER